MKKKLMIIGLMMLLVIANCIIVYAGAHSVSLKTSKTEVVAGETFTVKVNVVTPDGINGVVTTYDYDKTKLELVSENIIDTNFTNLGGTTENELTFLFTPKNQSSFTEITETDIYELTFKVKEGVAANSEATISLKNTEISTLAASNSEHKLPGDEITITVVEEKCEHSYKVKNDDKQHWNECEKCKETTAKENHKFTKNVDNKNGTHTSTCSVCSYRVTENHTYNNGICTDCKSEEEKKDDSSTPGKDDTVADGDINYAGIEDYIFIVVPTIAVLAVVLYKKSNKYRGI